MASDLWTLENPAFAFYTLCAAIVLFKTIIMSPLTGYLRVTMKHFAWPEDNVSSGLKPEVKPPHPTIERFRRCHQNDLENVIPFVMIGLFYTLTNPSLSTAKLLFGGFTALRVAHTFVFLTGIRQPFRFLTFTFAMAINFIMLISVIIHVLPKAL